MRYAVLLAWLLLLVVWVWLLRVTTVEVQPGVGEGVEADVLDVAPLTPVARAVVSGGGGTMVGKPSRWQDQILGINQVGEPMLPDYWFADISTAVLAAQKPIDPAAEWVNLEAVLAQLTNDVLEGEIVLTNVNGSTTTIQASGLSRGAFIESYVKGRMKSAQTSEFFYGRGWMKENVPPGYHGHPETGVIMKGEHNDETCPVR